MREEVEDILTNYKANKEEIRKLEQELECIDNDCGLSGVSYDSIGGGGGISDTTHDTVAIRIAKQKGIQQRIDQLEEEVRLVDDSMKILDDTEKQVLTEYYINNRKWWEVGEKLRYSEVHCRRIRNRAINKIIEKMFDF